MKDGVWSVTIGSQMEDWEKWELIKKFREEFKSCTIVSSGHGVNISGEAEMKTSF